MPMDVVALKVVVVEVRVVVIQYSRNLPFLPLPEASRRPESSCSNSSAKISSSSFAALFSI